jgi:hypothetical protein
MFSIRYAIPSEIKTSFVFTFLSKNVRFLLFHYFYLTFKIFELLKTKPNNSTLAYGFGTICGILTDIFFYRVSQKEMFSFLFLANE